MACRTFLPPHPKKESTKVTSASPATARRMSRRGFSTLAAGTAAALLKPVPRVLARTAPSDRITVGVIGLGSRGFNLVDALLRNPHCQITAVCDVDRFHYRDRPWGTGPAYGRDPAAARIRESYANDRSGTAHRGLFVCSDYRELLAQPDLDAVVVATPDHWHALCTWDALQAGCDVYCEKPVTHLFAEGRAIAEEVRRRQAIMQVGSQQRSDPLFGRLVEIVRQGLIGAVRRIEVGLPSGYDRPQGSTQVVSPRPDLDYDQWCGPAPRLPLMAARHHRWWRGHRAYGGGVLMDWIGHHNDIAHRAVDVERSGPLTVEAVDWTFPETDIYNTPHHYTIRCEYANGITSEISDSHPIGLKITGTDGWVYARRGHIEASDPRWLKEQTKVSGRLPHTQAHVNNFLDCVRSRQECVAPPDIAHRSVTPGHLGYVSWTLKRPLNWDPDSQTIRRDPEAAALLSAVAYRSPWKPPQPDTTG